MSFKHKPNKYITTINKGKEDSWNALRKATSITKKEYQKKEPNLQIPQYFICEHLRDSYATKLVNWHIWD